MESQHQMRAAFLDRDGVLNVDRGFVHKPQDFEWIPGAQAAIRKLNNAGYLTVVVTNQSGIARGYYTETQFRALHRWMNVRLQETGAHIDAVYFCPHLPDADKPRYRSECNCRKPKPGMLLRAIRELDIDPAQSFLIGDRASDCTAARAAGVAAHLFSGSDLLHSVNQILSDTGGARTHPVT